MVEEDYTEEPLVVDRVRRLLSDIVACTTCFAKPAAGKSTSVSAVGAASPSDGVAPSLGAVSPASQEENEMVAIHPIPKLSDFYEFFSLSLTSAYTEFEKSALVTMLKTRRDGDYFELQIKICTERHSQPAFANAYESLMQRPLQNITSLAIFHMWKMRVGVANGGGQEGTGEHDQQIAATDFAVLGQNFLAKLRKRGRDSNVSAEDVARRNLIKGVTADESVVIHDTSSLGMVDIKIDDQPDGGANALNINSLRLSAPQ
ncbi:hypothetical protein HAX54_002706 [Datura stramonium]|uniref:Uncharacterized protein n=1 Tax=Datura stramonium TaxID=4076 RepID=A0ABS8RTA8_DATST|nr:hypothetical protein [Datura stramonium]